MTTYLLLTNKKYIETSVLFTRLTVACCISISDLYLKLMHSSAFKARDFSSHKSNLKLLNT